MTDELTLAYQSPAILASDTRLAARPIREIDLERVDDLLRLMGMTVKDWDVCRNCVTGEASGTRITVRIVAANRTVVTGASSGRLSDGINEEKAIMVDINGETPYIPIVPAMNVMLEVARTVRMLLNFSESQFALENRGVILSLPA